MASLNQYASRVAHIVGQPDNVSLKERVKDMIKDYFAKYIIQSIDKNGITDYYKVTLEISMIPREETRVGSQEEDFCTEFISSNKLPRPMNIKNDSPFISVVVKGTNKMFSYMQRNMQLASISQLPTCAPLSYAIVDEKLIVKRHESRLRAVTKGPIQENEKLVVTGLWENPEDVIGYYSTDDNQDIDLPFPNEMFGFVILDLLKTEFNIVPKDSEVILK